MQDIHTKFFDTYEDAIAVYGSDVVRVRLMNPPPIVTLPCNLEMDCVYPQVQPMNYTEVTFRLQQFYIGDPNNNPTTFWRYCREV